MSLAPSSGHSAGRGARVPGPTVQHALKHPLLRAIIPTEVRVIQHAPGESGRSQKGTFEAVLIYCSAGSGWCEIAGRKFDVRPGYLVIIPPFTPHSWGCHDGEVWTNAWLKLTGENVQALIDRVGVSVEQPLLNLGIDPKLLALFDDAVSSAERETTYNTTTMFQSSQLAGHLLSVILAKARQAEHRPLEPRERIDQCIQFMKQNYGEPVSLQRLATIANLSPSHFGGLFRKFTGLSPMEYLIQIRIEQACVLLRSTNLPVKEIAGQVGYQNPLYFSEAFQHVLKTSPTEYRRTHGTSS